MKEISIAEIMVWILFASVLAPVVGLALIVTWLFELSSMTQIEKAALQDACKTDGYVVTLFRNFKSYALKFIIMIEELVFGY